MKKKKKEELSSSTDKTVDARRGTSVEAIKQSILDHVNFAQARTSAMATRNDWYVALAYAVRDRMFDRWFHVMHTLEDPSAKVVCYLSAEFLMGPHLGNALINLGIYENTQKAVAQLGHNLEDLLAQEEEPGLGNGGLGRLAACYMDSLASLGVPAMGYGIRYEFGIFDQEIKDGWQIEKTDKWLNMGNPWEIHRPEIAYYVSMGGHTESLHDEKIVA
jgi:glycogen phosphorylase